MKKFLCCFLLFVVTFAFATCYASVEENYSVSHSLYDYQGTYQNTFYDTRGTKYEGVVERMYKLKIVNGMTETTYAPNKSVTRAELAKMLTKMRNIDDYAPSVEYKKIYSDVKESDWFYPYVAIVDDLGLINGYEDGTFRPNQEVTYGELIVLLLRNLGYDNITEDNPEGWYYNYIAKMRELELNDNIGEVEYNKPAKRGDVAMFIWNALITDRWAISYENTTTGFTYTYSDITPLELFFDEYKFLDNETINAVGGAYDRVYLVVGKRGYYTREKTPLYVLGGKVTALYEKDSYELIGVTIDEDYDNLEIVSGPKFYLKEQGYNLTKATKTVSYGNKDNASFVYLVIDEDTDRIIRAVYVDASNSIAVESISVDATQTETSENDEKEMYKTITLNDESFFYDDAALFEDGFSANWNDVEEEEIITYLGYGLYAKCDQKITDIVTDFDGVENTLVINDEKYFIQEDCLCYKYKADEPVEFDTLTPKQLKEYIGKKATIRLNIAEEVCMIDFGKTNADEERYKIGFVTGTRYDASKEVQSIKVNYGTTESNYFEIYMGEDKFAMVGDLVSISTKDGVKQCQVITSDTAFDNDISIKYNYDAKEIVYPTIGEYMVDDDTRFYKVTLDYEDNSITNISNCEFEELYFGEDISDLSAYKLCLVYNEDMEIVKVFAINELNKFDNQIGLVKDLKRVREDRNTSYMKITLSVVNDAVRGYSIFRNYDKISSGDIITFYVGDGAATEDLVLEEVFKRESIGYKRDLIVTGYDKITNEVYFENGKTMKLTSDVYDWSGSKINLNRYRFILAEVSNYNGYWEFISTKMYDKDKIIPQVGDRVAIGELQDVIVVYRGYEE